MPFGPLLCGFMGPPLMSSASILVLVYVVEPFDPSVPLSMALNDTNNDIRKNSWEREQTRAFLRNCILIIAICLQGWAGLEPNRNTPHACNCPRAYSAQSFAISPSVIGGYGRLKPGIESHRYSGTFANTQGSAFNLHRLSDHDLTNDALPTSIAVLGVTQATDLHGLS